MIDTHAHIDDEQYQDHLDAFIREQQQAGVEAIIVPGVDETNADAVWQVCEKYPNYLYPAIGLHPENITPNWRVQLETLYSRLSTFNSTKLLSTFHFPLSTKYIAIGEIGLDYHFSTEFKAEQHAALREQLNLLRARLDSPIHRFTDSPKYIAIGEIGLDYHFSTEFKAEQHAALREQLGWAMERDLPALIHVRDATEDALTILKDYPGLRGIMHCWSGSEEVARQIVDMGLYLGIGGIITFKNCKLREHLGSIPLERLVLETDAPYMAPVPHRGERNESRWIKYVIDELSRIYQVSPEEVDRITTQSAKTLLL